MGRIPTTHKGKTIKDAPKDFGFRVSKESERDGIPKDCNRCAGAIELKSRPGIIDAWLTRTEGFIERKDAVYRYVLPDSEIDKLRAFDAKLGTRLRTITLKAPTGKKKLGGRKGEYAARKAKGQNPSPGSGSGKGSNLSMATNRPSAIVNTSDPRFRVFRGFNA